MSDKNVSFRIIKAVIPYRVLSTAPEECKVTLVCLCQWPPYFLLFVLYVLRYHNKVPWISFHLVLISVWLLITVRSGCFLELLFCRLNFASLAFLLFRGEAAGAYISGVEPLTTEVKLLEWPIISYPFYYSSSLFVLLIGRCLQFSLPTYYQDFSFLPNDLISKSSFFSSDMFN